MVSVGGGTRQQIFTGSFDLHPRRAKILDGVGLLRRVDPGRARVRRSHKTGKRLGNVPRDDERGDNVPAIRFRGRKADLLRRCMAG